MLKHAIDLNKYKNRDKGEKYHEEYQYLNLLKDIMEHGTLEEGRNGPVLTAVGSAMHFSLENGKIPILTTKKTAWKTCLKELLWFIRGDTSNKRLNDVGVHIWDANTTREFLDSRGLQHYEEGDVGSLYGYSWRFWNAPYKGCDADYTGQGIDQLQQVIDTLKIFEFSQIKHVNESDVIRDITLVDDELNQPEILHILNAMGQTVDVTFDENENVTIYF